jgi:thiol-disulfide isomerase/thioredoxin
MSRLYTLFILLAISSLGMAQKSVISGKITGFASPGVPEIQIFYDGKNQKIPVDKEQHTYKAELELKEPQFLEIKSGGSAVNFLYALPGENFELTIDKPILNETVIKIAEGNTQKLNLVMQKFFSVLEENGINTKSKSWSQDLYNRPALVSKALSSAQTELLSMEKSVSEKAPLFKTDFNLFAETLKKFIAVDNYSLKEIEAILDEISRSEMKITVLTIPLYRDLLVDITNAYAARKLENYDLVMEYQKNGYIALNIAAEACVKFIPNKGVINYLFFDKITREMAVNNVKHQKYLDYLLANSGKTVTDNFIKRYETMKANATSGKISDRVVAKDFEFQDISGKKYHLSDFKGKLLLLDFWASWCAPCKVQIPYMKELEKIYAGKNIVVASISLDVSKEAWLKSAKEEDLHNLILHSEKNFKDPFVVAYGINAIPRFMLIDAEGKIISDNLPKPQNKKEVMALIDADLYKADLVQILTKHFEAVGVDKLLNGNGLLIKSQQSLMGIEIDIETAYSYPKNFRYVYQPKENKALFAALGEDFFKKRYMVVKKDTAFGSIKDLDRVSKIWSGKLQGLDIFIASKVENLSLDFAEENSTNTDNQIVLKVKFSNRTEKYFLDKSDFLIKKMVQIGNLEPRMGGGFMEADTKYGDYKKVNGVMIPHSIVYNNIINFKVLEAEVKPLDKSIFSAP